MLAEKSSTTFTGQTARHELFGKVWKAPDQKAVVCIIHGFGEHLGRYTHVAEYFNAKNTENTRYGWRLDWKIEE